MEDGSTSPRRVRVFISHSHDDEGRLIASRLAEWLAEAGFDVVWDPQITDDNPATIPEWITSQIEGCLVVCVLSPDYVHRFGKGDGSSERKGTLFEGRIIMNLFWDHTETNNCPVVLVVRQDFSVDSLPHALKGRPLSRVDPETRAGEAQLVQRLRSLGAGSGRPLVVDASAVVSPPRMSRVRTLRDIMYELETAVPSTTEAVNLVCEWIEASEGNADFIRAFGAVVRIIKSVGDVDLGTEVAELCLGVLDHDRLLQSDKEIRAKVLILLSAWCFRRQGYLDLARDAVEEGIALAEECDDSRLVALGEGSLGRIHRGLAEVAEPADRDRHLDDAKRLTKKAIAKFEALGRDEEVGVYYTVLARIAFTKYELLRKRKHLKKASEYADRAGRSLPPARVRDCFELQILRARIDVERRRFRPAQHLLDQVIADLGRRGTEGASYVELLGRAHQARARLCRLWRGRDVMTDVEEALRIFWELGLDQAFAECCWLKAKVLLSGLSRRDGRILERLCADPRVRLAAVEERRLRVDRGIKGRWWARTKEWREIVEKVRRTG